MDYPFIDMYPKVINNYLDGWNCIRLFFGNTPYIAHNIIKGGRAFFGGYSGKNEFYNNLFIVADGLYFSDTTYFINNVITGHPAVGIQIQGYGSIANNSISNAGLVFKSNIPSDPVIQYNNIWNYQILKSLNVPEIDSTNTFNDPMFVQDTSDFHLQLYSRLINAGDPSILNKDSSRSDIGMYGGPLGESYTYQDLAPRIPVNISAVYDTNEILIKWNKNTESDFAGYKVYRDTSAEFIIDSTKLISAQTDTFFIQHTPSGINALYYKVTAYDSQGNESPPSEEVAVILSGAENNVVVVNDYKLYQNYPNPFNPSTKIGYRLKERGYVKLYVYDIKGELAATLVNTTREAGYYEVEFTGNTSSKGEESLAERLASGIYIYRLMIRNENNIPVFTDSKKMMLLK